MRLFVFIVFILVSACRGPESKYLILEMGESFRHPGYRQFYSNKIVRKDSCILFLGLDNDTCLVCGNYRVIEQ